MTTKKPYDSRTADKFLVRLPEGSRDKLQQLARSRFSSMNAIAVEAIEKYIDTATSTEVQVPVTEGMYVCHKKKSRPSYIRWKTSNMITRCGNWLQLLKTPIVLTNYRFTVP